MDEIHESSSSAESDIKANEILELIQKALARLPMEQRQVFLLREHSGLSFKEIARIQNAPIPTVQGRYRYGIDKLRSFFNGELT